MITTVLNIIRPGSEWTLNGDNYDGLVWLDHIQTKPTEAEIIAATPAAVLAQIKSKLTASVQAYINQTAQSRSFYDIDSITKYINLTDAQILTMPLAQRPLAESFRLDANKLAVWTTSVWAYCYLNESSVTVNTTWEQLLLLLPATPIF